MSYHIRPSRVILCEQCADHETLFSATDKLAKGEAEQLGWRHTSKGWLCPWCWEDRPR